MYYALTDFSTGDNPKQHTHGFADTKEVVAFHTKDDRDAWLSTTKLLTAKAITRREALKLTKWVSNSGYHDRQYRSVKEVRVYGDGFEFTALAGK